MNNIIWIAIPLFVVAIALELLVFRRGARLRGTAVKGYEKRDTAASLAMGLGNVAISALWKAVPVGAYFVVYEYAGWFSAFLAPEHGWAWLLLFFGDDFCYYWFHRAGHRMRFAWAGHVNHHSSQHYNLSTALRQSWTSPLFKFVFYLPLPLLGFHPLMILVMQTISLIYQFWIHTEAIDRLPGWFEAVFNTPSHHRVHHGSNPIYIDRNYGGFLIVFDKWFGTFEPESEPVRYGLVNNIDTYNPVKVAFHAWGTLLTDMRNSTSLRNAVGHFFMYPAWRPADEPPHAVPIENERY